MQEEQPARILLALQELDIRVLRLQKRLDELPQRLTILEIRKKLAQAQEKSQKTQSLGAEVDRVFDMLQDEAAQTAQQIKQTQLSLNNSSDFRETSILSKELEMLRKRAEKIERDSLAQMEKKDKVDALAAQLAPAADRLKASEEAVTESYQEVGGALKQQLADANHARDALLGTLEPGLKQRYLRDFQTKGGIGVARLENGQCSGCHVTLSEGQIARLNAGPLIDQCPNCSRLMVVRER